MICTTSSLCIEREGHAHLFPFSSCHELECQDLGQPSWAIRCKSWVRRTEQQAKISTMTYEVLCDSAIPKPSGLHWSVHYRNIDWSLCCSPWAKHSLVRGTLYCWKLFPHISSPHTFTHSRSLLKYHFSSEILWPPCQEFQQYPLPPVLVPPHLLYFSPQHTSFHNMLNTLLFIMSNCLVDPTRLSAPGGQGCLLFCSLLCFQGLKQCLEYSRWLINL